jgi:hypothetical protein
MLDKVSEFVKNITKIASKKAREDFEKLTAKLPTGVSLTETGTIYPYDIGWNSLLVI